MRGVEKGDMTSSIKALFKEDDDKSSSSPSQSTDKSDSNGGEEPTTPPTTQRSLGSGEVGSSNYRYRDANYTFSRDNNPPPATNDHVVNINDEEEEEEDEEGEEDEDGDGDKDEDENENEDEDEDEDGDENEDEDEEEESNKGATSPSSEESDQTEDNGAPAQESRSNTGDPSNDDGVEPEHNPNPSTDNERLILSTSRKKKGYLSIKVVLYQAAIKGDWKGAKSIFDVDSSAITMKITDSEDTPLHIAAAAKHISFVEKLVQLFSSDELAIQNIDGNTALAFAAASGVVRIAEVMVNKNPNLPNLCNNKKTFPVLNAVAYKRKDMASFLFHKTDFEALNNSERIELLISTITSDYYDIALDILQKKPGLALAQMDGDGETALHVLAKKSSSIGSSSELGFWKGHMNSRFKGFYKTALMKTLAHQTVERIWNYVVKNLSKADLYTFIKTPSRLLHDAARVGNAEFLIILISSYPDLLWKVDEDDKSIFHVAVENRQESVFSLIYEIGGLKDFLANYKDTKTNSNMLHLAGKLAAPYHLSRVSGAALQMQRELLWFTEVEQIVVSSYQHMRSPNLKRPQVEIIKDSKDTPTPRELFTKAYKRLLKDGDKWMRNEPGAKVIVSSHLQMKRDPVPELSTMEIVREPVESLTPRELFTKEHKQLLKDGEEWMKNTANSCMLVATLIATVVFAAAFTVPGGNNSEKGTPVFRQNQAFTLFVVSDVIALVLSTTSILTFLSILTSRYAEDDFRMSLPLKLLFGLGTLFLSIVCMLVAFSAAFFIAYDKGKAKIPLAIAIVAILPVLCFCVFHAKLVFDVLRSAYWSQSSLRKRKQRLFY